MGERAAVFMNTQYGDPSVKAYKKKDPRTGSTKNLFGYTVGSRAPPMSVKSGNVATYGYGISNRDGGQLRLRQERAARGDAPNATLCSVAPGLSTTGPASTPRDLVRSSVGSVSSFSLVATSSMLRKRNQVAYSQRPMIFF